MWKQNQKAVVRSLCAMGRNIKTKNPVLTIWISYQVTSPSWLIFRLYPFWIPVFNDYCCCHKLRRKLLSTVFHKSMMWPIPVIPAFMAEAGESRVSDKPGLLDETLLKIVIIIICTINNNYLVVMHICLYSWHLGDRSRKIKSYTVWGWSGP